MTFNPPITAKRLPISLEFFPPKTAAGVEKLRELSQQLTKVKAGTDSAITQCFYNADGCFGFAEEVRKQGLGVVSQLCKRLIAAEVPALHFYTMEQSPLVPEVARRLGVQEAVQ